MCIIKCKWQHIPLYLQRCLYIHSIGLAGTLSGGNNQHVNIATSTELERREKIVGLCAIRERKREEGRKRRKSFLSGWLEKKRTFISGVDSVREKLKRYRKWKITDENVNTCSSPECQVTGSTTEECEKRFTFSLFPFLRVWRGDPSPYFGS